MRRIHDIIMAFSEDENNWCFKKRFDDLTKIDYENYSKQHLYIVSNETIVEGDFVINDNTKTITQYKGHGGMEWWKKIIATTNKNLRIYSTLEESRKETCVYYTAVPLIPEWFVDYFISIKGNINKVKIEYTVDIKKVDNQERVFKKPKTNDNNEITITIPGDEEYTKEEVESLVRNSFFAGRANSYCDAKEALNILENWIIVNL